MPQSRKSYLLFDFVHQGVKLQLNPPRFIPPPVVKPKKPAQTNPCLSQMSKKLHQYLAETWSGKFIFMALDCNVPEMGKLPNSVEECVPINIGFLHAAPQSHGVLKQAQGYDDVGGIADVGGSVCHLRSNAPKLEV